MGKECIGEEKFLRDLKLSRTNLTKKKHAYGTGLLPRVKRGNFFKA
jgi:hypothetical protein